MKKVSVLLGLLWGGFCQAHDGQDLHTNEVPSVVLNGFQTKYPNARDVEWEFKHGYYEVEFAIGKREFEIKYNEKGQIRYYEEELTVAQLPLAVRQSIAKHFSGYRISEVKKKDGGKVSYEVELKKGMGEEHEVLFNAKGEVLMDELD